jgi:hypothetical protein
MNTQVRNQSTGNHFVWKITNNSIGDNNGRSLYVANKFSDELSIRKQVASYRSSSTTGGGNLAASLDILEYGMDSFTAESVVANVDKVEAESIKKALVVDTDFNELYNAGAVATLGLVGQTELAGRALAIKKRSPKMDISSINLLKEGRIYLQVNGQFHDSHPAFSKDLEIGDTFKGGKVEAVLDYSSFVAILSKAQISKLS